MKPKSFLIVCALAFFFSAFATSGQMTYFEGPQKSSLDFTTTADGKIVIAATVAGTPTSLFLDTGATTIVDINFAREIGLNPLETEEVGTGITGIAGKRWIARVDITIGKMKITSFPVSCLDLSALRELNRSKNTPDLFGLIGSDLLQVLRAKIDYENSSLTIKRPGRKQLQADEAATGHSR